MGYEIEPVAIFHCSKTSPAEAPRQGSLNTSEEVGEIRFKEKLNFEQALIGLEKFSHLWLIYRFHKNENWKTMVLPPRGSETKVGVFATRSPYRPNFIGMSVVKLERVEGLSVFVKGFDLLDQTPILDVKPYLNYADSVPEANLGWIQPQNEFEVIYSSEAEESLMELKQELPEFRNFIQAQLGSEPLLSPTKRIKMHSEHEGILAYKTFRAEFSLNAGKIEVQKIRTTKSL